jgi:hypothetical protein
VVCGIRGLRQFPVRGTAKALAAMLLFALAHNIMRAITVLAGSGTTKTGRSRGM